MPPVVCIVGRTNSGKTTLIEKLVSELTDRGYRIGTIKHATHPFDIDVPGKDSWRHAQAGAATVAIASSQRLAVIRELDGEWSLDTLVDRYFDDVDLVIAEGYKASQKPKIEVLRTGVSEVPLCDTRELLAWVTDGTPPSSLPTFPSDAVPAVADLIVRTFLSPTPPSGPGAASAPCGVPTGREGE